MYCFAQNIFPVLQENGTLRIKIGDFGVSKHIPEDSSTVLRTEVGTTQYRAPEVAGSEYTCTVDCWSVGCIVYRLVVGRDLFKDLDAVYKFKFTGAPSPVSALVDCGDDCPDFVGKLITVDPDRRLDAATALDHPWILHFPNSETDQNRKYIISTNLRIRFSEALDNLKDREP